SGSCQRLTHLEQTNSEDWCDMGDAPERDPSVLVIGDSYSKGYGDMLRKFSKQNPQFDLVYRSYARGRCRSLLGYGPTYCREIVKFIYDYIARTDSIKTVVIAHNARIYVDGAHYPEEDWRETPESYVHALEHSIEVIRSHGKRVVAFWAQPPGRAPVNC